MKRFVKRLALASLVVGMMVLVASPAQAQSTRTISVAYQAAHLSQGSFSEFFPYGFNVDVASELTSMIAIVGEAGGIYKSLTVANGASASLSQYAFQAGVRVLSKTNAMYTPFGQILAGVTTVKGSGPGGDSSNSSLTVQFGGGVDYKATDVVGVRFGADYRWLHGDPTENDFRFLVGVSFSFGK